MPTRDDQRLTVCLPDTPDLVHVGELPANVNILLVRAAPAPLPDLANADMVVPTDRIVQPLRELLAGPPGRLRVIQTLSAGVDSLVGLVPAHVTVCNARGVYDEPVAEWVVGAILAMQRGLIASRDAQARSAWAPFVPDELRRRRVVILGHGSIGSAVAERLRPFGVEITGVGRTARAGVRAVADLDDVLAEADILVSVLPLTRETRHMLDARTLALLPDGALVVNAGRGATIDTGALTRELAAGRLRAALDVVDPEPLPGDHLLWTLPNVLLSPHVAGDSPTTDTAMFELVGDQVRRLAAGRPLLNVVPRHLLDA
jgi:phosphoglycerate dehydrogenase-like enzyme